MLRLTLFVVLSTGAHAAALLVAGDAVRVPPASASAAPEYAVEIDLQPSDAIERIEAARGPEPTLAAVNSFQRPLHAPRAAPRATPTASTATEASPRDEADDAPPIAVRACSAPASAPAAAPAPFAADVEAPRSAPLPATSVDGKARLLRGAAPAYPAQARADGVEGTVGLELVVDASGSLESARVVRGAGHGLDEAALAAAKQFRFTPATKDGRAVRVRMGWSIDFRFRD